MTLFQSTDAAGPSPCPSSQADIRFEVRDGVGVATPAMVALDPERIWCVCRRLADMAPQCQHLLVVEATPGRLNCLWLDGLLWLDRQCRRGQGAMVLSGINADDEDMVRAAGLDGLLTLAQSTPEGVAMLAHGAGRMVA